MIFATVRAVFLAGTLGSAAMAQTVTHLDYDDLDGWTADDHGAALAVFRNTCGDLTEPDWKALCALAAEVTDPRAFFELFFRPVLIEDGEPMLFTGYFEPELDGAPEPDDSFQYPVYALPPDMRPGALGLTRREIEESAILANRNLEIAWVDDPVELFFLQIQGSGRIRMPDGQVIRVGYSGANGHPYSSIGQELVARGIYEPHQVSAEVIRNWVRRNPDEGQALLWVNQSYVFFREVSEVPADQGPLGAMNRSVTPLRSIAVDPNVVPLGAPVWIEKAGEQPMNRLMVAQDTGSAIRGAQRADIFFGTGFQAGQQAGRIRDGGRMVVLLPIQRAYAMLPETVTPQP